MKVHHNTAKKAKAHGITLTVDGDEIVATKGERRLASGLSGTLVLEQAIVKAGGESKSPMGRALKKVTEKADKPTKAPKAKKVSEHEQAARDEGWTPKKGGGFRQADADGEEGGDSDAKDWRALCAEQDIEVDGGDEGKSIIKRKFKDRYKPHSMTCGDDLTGQLREYLTYEDDGGVMRIDEGLLKEFAKANDCWVESYASLANVGQRRMNIGNRLRAKMRRDPDFKITWPK